MREGGDLREGISESSFERGTEEEQSQEEPNTSEGGAYLWVYDEYDEGRIEDEVDRDETECGRHRTVKSRLQHGPVRTDHAVEVGVVRSRSRNEA